jgi:hypothetical protein
LPSPSSSVIAEPDPQAEPLYHGHPCPCPAVPGRFCGSAGRIGERNMAAGRQPGRCPNVGGALRAAMRDRPRPGPAPSCLFYLSRNHRVSFGWDWGPGPRGVATARHDGGQAASAPGAITAEDRGLQGTFAAYGASPSLVAHHVGYIPGAISFDVGSWKFGVFLRGVVLTIVDT